MCPTLIYKSNTLNPLWTRMWAMCCYGICLYIRLFCSWQAYILKAQCSYSITWPWSDPRSYFDWQTLIFLALIALMTWVTLTNLISSWNNISCISVARYIPIYNDRIRRFLLITKLLFIKDDWSTLWMAQRYTSGFYCIRYKRACTCILNSDHSLFVLWPDISMKSTLALALVAAMVIGLSAYAYIGTDERKFKKNFCRKRTAIRFCRNILMLVLHQYLFLHFWQPLTTFCDE